MNYIRCVFLLATLVLVPVRMVYAQHHEHRHGKVDFAISCAPAAQERFSTGLALVHHMMYDQAEAEFVRAAEADPECAMAHWGVAMSIIHPLWGERPTDAAQKKGQEALAKARSLNPPTEREAAYVAALETFYRDWENTPYPAQLAGFETGFKKLHEAYPDDVDAAAFYALGHLATAPREDRAFSQQKTAGALLEQLHQRAPEHPGLFHYIIHSYDNPVLADRAVTVARAYDKIAPDVPHALHMPSHIFIRLGLWSDAVDWNSRSAAAALRQPVGDATSMHYAHALDYLAYGYLQQGQDAKAGKVVEDLMAARNLQPTLASAYAMAAVPARYALERGRWDEAAALPVRADGAFPWDRFPAAESITYFARGIGAAGAGDAAGARAAIESLDKLHARLTESGEAYWAVLTDAQRKAVAAWVAFSGGDLEGGLEMMKGAADLEDSVDKHPVTPGPVLPIREIYGHMLLVAGKPAEALQAYEASLRVSPNRFTSLYGAGQAAEQEGDLNAAKTYYAKLVEVAATADHDRTAVSKARQFVARQ